jgi:hypothetical protein
LSSKQLAYATLKTIAKSDCNDLSMAISDGYSEKWKKTKISSPAKLVGNDHKYENGGCPETCQSLLTSLQ